MAFAIYPRQSNLATGVVIGLSFLFVGRHMVGLAVNGGSDEPFLYPVGFLAAVVGLWFSIACGYRLLRPAPSFAADEDGFSVMGRSKRPWSEFQGVSIHKLRIYFIPTLAWVIVRVGNGKGFARRVHIKWTHLSGPAHHMADEILRIAAQAQSMTEAVQFDLSSMFRSEEAHTGSTKPAAVQKEAKDVFATSPIVSAEQDLRKRIFG